MGFQEGFISRVQALGSEAESRILFNDQLLPTFQVAMGVRKDSLLSPLLFVLATIPVIEMVNNENMIGKIRPVQLEKGLKVSSMCLADVFAFFTAVHRESMINLLSFLSLVQLASGGKVNMRKSKLLLIGGDKKFPSWAANAGTELVNPHQPVIYLDAPLTTIWKGADNSAKLLDNLKRKAQYFTSSLMPFESRVIALKHAVFPTLIYQLLTTTFKKAGIKNSWETVEFCWRLSATVVAGDSSA
ncbi:hypothetical protein R1sor_020488 [Riccia sorocarpa]|uniref:Reverse transcriptase domain-containing protein n=1 Tax=Riccia sorocarpa TaxID=122646 RepID=A0ABD3IGM9_9MARC